MQQGIIRLSFLKTIDSNTLKKWDRIVFENTYLEYKMQSAHFNQQNQETIFLNLLAQNPEAEKLHYLVSKAALENIKQLNKIIPDLNNTQNIACIPFSNFKFQLINSDTTNKKLHEFTILFVSEPLILLNVMNNHLLVANGNQLNNYKQNKEIETNLIAMQAMLNIHSYSNIE